MSAPEVLRVPTAAGAFRVLRWGAADGPAALFLHGLSGVAEVWGPTTLNLDTDRQQCFAIDQRGHGHSPKPASGYAVGDYIRDAAAVIAELNLAPVRLVGHSMGARVAFVLAARRPDLVSSLVVVDIGPEAWTENWKQTVASLDRLPPVYASMDAALATASRVRGDNSLDSAARQAALRAVAEARLRQESDGSVTWLASLDALKQTVMSHRSRNYWREWATIRVPTLLIRGGTSTELRPRIAAKMRDSNSAVRYEEFDGVGHNIPLLAPERLAGTLSAFWQTAGAQGT